MAPLLSLRRITYGAGTDKVVLASLEQRERFKGHSIIETVFSVLKDRLGLVTSLPRSLDGYLTHYILILLAYQLARWVTHALGTPALPNP
jgi:hypothetical protein